MHFPGWCDASHACYLTGLVVGRRPAALLEAAAYHMQALESAFALACLQGRQAPGLAGFRVRPEHTEAVCAGLLEDRCLQQARGKHYTRHMLQLYRLHQQAAACQDSTTLRLLEEFVVVDAAARSISRHAPVQAVAKQCTADYDSMALLVSSYGLEPVEAFTAMWLDDQLQDAVKLYRQFGASFATWLTPDTLVELSDYAAVFGHPALAWELLEAHQPDGGQALVLKAVQLGRLACLAAKPVLALTLLWVAGHYEEALAVYQEFSLQAVLKQGEKADLLQHAAAEGQHRVLGSILDAEMDGGINLVVNAVRSQHAAVVLSLLQQQGCGKAAHLRSPAVLRRIIEEEGGQEPVWQQLLEVELA